MSGYDMEQGHQEETQQTAGNRLGGAINREATNQARKDSIPPAGTYVTVGGLGISVKAFEANEKGPARRVVTAFGPVLGVGSKNDGVETNIRIRLSPDRRDKESGEPDFLHKMWLQADSAYKQAHNGEEAKDEDQILDYLESYPVSLSCFQGEDSLVATRINAVKA